MHYIVSTFCTVFLQELTGLLRGAMSALASRLDSNKGGAVKALEARCEQQVGIVMHTASGCVVVDVVGVDSVWHQ